MEVSKKIKEMKKIMSIFTKEEKLNIDKKTGKSIWITTKKGVTIPKIPKIRRKQPTALDQKVKAFQKKERDARKATRSKKITGYKKKWSNAQDWIGGNINPDILSIGGSLPSSSTSSSKKKTSSKKSGKPQYIIRGGIAYKIAGTGKKKKKKGKPRQSDDDWLDPFDMDVGGGLF